MALLSVLNGFLQELQSRNLFNLSLFLVLFTSIFVLFWHRRSSTGKQIKLKLPPSPPRLPLIGNLHNLGAFPHRSLLDLSKKYGALMMLNLGKMPTLIVSSAEMAKEVMKTQDMVFCSRPQNTAAGILFYDYHDVAFAPYGEYWRQVRRICVLELLSHKRVHQFQYARVEEVADLMSKIREASSANGGDQTSPVNLAELLTSTSNNIICRCILGQKFDKKEDTWFGDTTKELMTQVMSFCFGDFFPSLKWLDRVRGHLDYLKSIWLEFDRFFDKLIAEHKAAKKEGKAGKKDIVDFLLDVQNDGSFDFQLTTDNVKALLQDLFVGGSDTSWTASIWLMTEISKNPRVMKKVQEEVRRVAGKRGYVDEADIPQMTYMTCVIKENMRLHPPAPLLLPREATADVKLGGYDIPAKTQVFVNAYAVQRDPKVWDKPDEFIPERFEDNMVGFVGENFELIPFGAGRRVCPGLAFGVASAQYVAANLLYWFDWKLPSGGRELDETMDMREVYGLTVHKKAPLNLILVPYSP